LATETPAICSGIAVAILSPKINKLVSSTLARMMNQLGSTMGTAPNLPIAAISIVAFGSLWLKHLRKRNLLV
jgi:hypothetical protein